MVGGLGSEAELSRENRRSGKRSGAGSGDGRATWAELMTSRGSWGDDGDLIVDAEVLANVEEK